MPGRRFTYSQQYHSATVEPGALTSKNHTMPTAASLVWSTWTGSYEPEVQPKHPDVARVEELRKVMSVWRSHESYRDTISSLSTHSVLFHPDLLEYNMT